jgi:heme exporter protein A
VPTAASSNRSEVSLTAHGLVCVRDDRVLFEGLDFALGPGELLLVEGRNGSGKTSLLRILAGMRLQEEGEVRWCGEPIQEVRGDYFDQIAYVGHLNGIKRELTPLENLRVTQALGRPSGIDLEVALEELGLAGFEDTPVQNLSAGQRRRLALARLLINDSLLWILDEPFTSLDREGMRRFEALVEGHLSGGGLAVMTAHHDVELPGSRVKAINLSE